MHVAFKTVANRSQFAPQSLSDVIPPSIAWVSRQQALEILGLSDESSLRRDQAVLLYLETPGFDYQPHQRGFSWESLNVLWEFRKLVREQGRARAIKQINQKMRTYYEQFGSETRAAS